MAKHTQKRDHRVVDLTATWPITRSVKDDKKPKRNLGIQYHAIPARSAEKDHK